MQVNPEDRRVFSSQTRLSFLLGLVLLVAAAPCLPAEDAGPIKLDKPLMAYWAFDEEELYDHQSDPHEWHNRANDPAGDAIRRELRDEMMKLLWRTR